MAQATVRATLLRPLHDRVLIKRLEEQDARHGSIFIPDTAQEKPQEGRSSSASIPAARSDWTARSTSS